LCLRQRPAPGAVLRPAACSARLRAGGKTPAAAGGAGGAGAAPGAKGNERAAETLLRRLVALNPNIFWATNELTLLLMAKGNLAEAEVHARNAVRVHRRRACGATNLARG